MVDIDIDRQSTYGRYQHRLSMHLRENTVDIKIDRQSAYGNIQFISTIDTIHNIKKLVDMDRRCDSHHKQIDRRTISTVEVTQTQKNSHG